MAIVRFGLRFQNVLQSARIMRISCFLFAKHTISYVDGTFITSHDGSVSWARAAKSNALVRKGYAVPG